MLLKSMFEYRSAGGISVGDWALDNEVCKVKNKRAA